MPDTEYALIEDDAEDVPEDERCIWPGCTRRRAPGRTGGSGRQKEYCLKADRPGSGGGGTGGGPVHNARNRWAWQRRDAAGNEAAARAGEAADAAESLGNVRDKWPVSAAKQRAGELLEQARRQHAAALSAFTAELDLYAQVAEQFHVMADPASRDLEITAISLKAGRDVSAAGEEVARAQRAQLTAESERDDAMRRAAEADAAAEQLAEDTDAAERAAADAERHLAERTSQFEEALAERTAEFEQTLAERTASFEQARAELEQRALAAETRAEEAVAQAAAAETAANQAITVARARAEAAIADAREEAAGQVRAAQEGARTARQQADTIASEARREVTAAREAAERARSETDSVRQDADRARDDAQARILAATTEAATANARAAAVDAETARLREELSRLRDERAAEVARLEAAHHSALAAERGRADRAEAELDTLRQARPGSPE